MKHNEDTRVKIPAILHLVRLGYDYLSLKDADLIPVRLIVHKKVSKYFKRQSLSNSQTITDYPDDENYDYLDIWVTDVMEIIPTIQQYLPYIKVESPDSLHKRIEENIQNYSNFNLPKE